MIKPGQIREIIEQNMRPTLQRSRSELRDLDVDWEAVARELNDLVMKQLTPPEEEEEQKP